MAARGQVAGPQGPYPSRCRPVGAGIEVKCRASQGSATDRISLATTGAYPPRVLGLVMRARPHGLRVPMEGAKSAVTHSVRSPRHRAGLRFWGPIGRVVSAPSRRWPYAHVLSALPALIDKSRPDVVGPLMGPGDNDHKSSAIAVQSLALGIWTLLVRAMPWRSVNRDACRNEPPRTGCPPMRTLLAAPMGGLRTQKGRKLPPRLQDFPLRLGLGASSPLTRLPPSFESTGESTGGTEAGPWVWARPRSQLSSATISPSRNTSSDMPTATCSLRLRLAPFCVWCRVPSSAWPRGGPTGFGSSSSAHKEDVTADTVTLATAAPCLLGRPLFSSS